MQLGDPDTKRQKRIVLGVAFVFFVVFILVYRQELVDVFVLNWARLKILVHRESNLDPRVYVSEAKLLYNLVWGVIVTGTVWIVLVSQQATLPIRRFNLTEVFRASWHLVLWILQLHGQAIFVRDGASNATKEDNQREGPGVVVIDYNSAVVFETQITPVGLSSPVEILLSSVSRVLGLSERPENPRVRGAGVVFTNPHERIRGTVDLRKQFRLQRAIHCYTRDGIEIFANVHCTFTLGQHPEILFVTYDGEPRKANLRVITFEPVADGFLRVSSISDSELDEADANEVHQFFRVVDRTHEWTGYPGRPAYPPDRTARERLTPKYDPERVFAAVFAKARSSGDEHEQINWSELPARVACEYYREILTRVNYDEIYNFSLHDRTSPFQLSQYRRKLFVRMRSCGLLSYRFIAQKDGEPFEKGRVVRVSNLMVSDAHPLRNPKVLRDRGIKVIASGFGDPSPVSEMVLERRLDAWRATWDRDVEIRTAEAGLRASQLRSQAHALALQDLTYALSRILEDRQYSDEVIAMRVLQALEAAAGDARTRTLLPGSTPDMLKYVQALLQSPGQEAPSSTMQNQHF